MESDSAQARKVRFSAIAPSLRRQIPCKGTLHTESDPTQEPLNMKSDFTQIDGLHGVKFRAMGLSTSRYLAVANCMSSHPPSTHRVRFRSRLPAGFHAVSRACCTGSQIPRSGQLHQESVYRRAAVPQSKADFAQCLQHLHSQPSTLIST
jgi:hypothetical protein